MQIRRQNDSFILVDLDSYNGAFLNGRRITVTSTFVTWGGHARDLGILGGMILVFFVGTVVVLRSQDV
jgi:pSer/pThr/pTyr-binding forkhead associated (FHA) protein